MHYVRSKRITSRAHSVLHQCATVGREVKCADHQDGITKVPALLLRPTAGAGQTHVRQLAVENHTPSADSNGFVSNHMSSIGPGPQ